MKKIFRIIKRLLLLGFLITTIWAYQTIPTVRGVTNDSAITLKNKIQKAVKTGNLSYLKVNFSQISQAAIRTTSTKKNVKTWSKPEATVYIDIQDDKTLYSASQAAIKRWNDTGAFTFKQTKNKADAQIVINSINTSSTTAAGKDSNFYNPLTGNLIKSQILLNKYYLENRVYNYSQERIINTVVHELGHAVGLRHTNSVSVMYPKGSFYSIQPNDVENVKKLYHKK